MGDVVDDRSSCGAAAAENLELKLTLSEDSEMLEQDLQEEACRGICQDIIIEQLVYDRDSSLQDHHDDINLSSPITTKRWPLVVVDRETSPEVLKPAVTPLPSGRKRSFRFTKSTTSRPEPVVANAAEIVDLVFVDQDKDSCVLGIEVCSSPSDKITDLNELQQRSTPLC